MNTELREALDRTLLLMRDDVDADDATLLKALTTTDIALVADEAALSCHSGQTAFVTAALLMARSGHRVHLVAPDVGMVGLQTPLNAGRLVTELVAISHDLITGVELSVGRPRAADLEIRLGGTPTAVLARRSISIGSTPWSAQITSRLPATWTATTWPFGGLTAGGLAATEAFKVAMWKLASHARNPALFQAQFASIDELDFQLAPPTARRTSALKTFDCISAGAIAQAALFVLAHIPDVTGQAHAFDDDVGALSNLNRNLFSRRSTVGVPKVAMLSQQRLDGLRLEPLPLKYDATAEHHLTDRVLVGVDHIPTRWEVQRTQPAWLGIGATSHWSVMTSFHTDGLPCAGCLHPTDSPDAGPIPTVAFVSFWAGLLLAADYVRTAAGEVLPAAAQHSYLTALRPEALWRGPVTRHPVCPVCHTGSARRGYGEVS